MMKSPETRSDETQHSGMEMMRIIDDARHGGSVEKRRKLQEDIRGYLNNEQIDDGMKEQMLNRIVHYAKDPADKQFAADRLAELSEAKTEQDIKEGVQRIEDYANEGFDERERDVQRASDEDLEKKDAEDEETREERRRKERIDLEVELGGPKVAREADRIVRKAERIPKDAEALIQELEGLMNPEGVIKEVEEHLKDKDAIDKELKRSETRVALEKSRIGNALATLDDESRSVIEGLFGLNKRHAKKAEEVADEVGLSVERVLEIRERMLEQLSKEMPQP